MPALLLRSLPLSFTLFVATLVGCGGRTETIGPDDGGSGGNEPAGGASGSGAGPSGQAGAPTGISGASPAGGAPAAGAPSAGGSPAAGASGAGSGGVSVGGSPSTGLAICADYCGALAKGACASETSLPECQGSCNAEIGQESPLCQKLAEAVVSCFIPIVSNNFGACDDLKAVAGSKCSPELTQYETCLGSTPVPDPSPIPGRNCTSSGNATVASCNLNVTCVDGPNYAVQCKELSPTQSACSCQASNGPGVGTSLGEPAQFACEDALALCNGIGTLPPMF